MRGGGKWWEATGNRRQQEVAEDGGKRQEITEGGGRRRRVTESGEE